MQLFGFTAFQAAVVLVFIAALLLIESAFLLWQRHHGSEALKLSKRLGRLDAAREASRVASLLNARTAANPASWSRRLLPGATTARIDALLAQSGLAWSLSTLFGASAVAAVLGALAGSLLLHSGFAAPFAAAAATLPFAWVYSRRRRRMRLMERQLPELLDHISRALRAGHGFSAALQMAGEEMQEPLAEEFRTVHDEINFGVSMQQALANLSQRVPIGDIRMFVVAVVIQREAGGNLTEMLTKLARLIRERMRLHAKVRVLSSEGRMSVWILTCMPFALGAGMFLANPEFMRPLWTDPMGIVIVKAMLVLMALGLVATRAIVRIRY